MTHEEQRENLTLFALGELRDEERRALEAHLSTCPECLAEETALRDAAAALAHIVPPVQPPAELRARLLAEVARMKPDAQRAEPASGAARVLPFKQPPRAGQKRRAFTSIAAALLVAVLLVALFLLWRRNRELQNEVAGLSRRLEATQAELDDERGQRELLSAAETSVHQLAGTPVAPRATATLAFDQRTRRAILFARNLPPAPAGKAYQLWFIADGKALPGGVFQVTADGRATFRDEVPAAGLKASLFAVTLEAQSGAPAPTGDKFLVSSSS